MAAFGRATSVRQLSTPDPSGAGRGPDLISRINNAECRRWRPPVLTMNAESARRCSSALWCEARIETVGGEW